MCVNVCVFDVCLRLRDRLLFRRQCNQISRTVRHPSIHMYYPRCDLNPGHRHRYPSLSGKPCVGLVMLNMLSEFWSKRMIYPISRVAWSICGAPDLDARPNRIPGSDGLDGIGREHLDLGPSGGYALAPTTFTQLDRLKFLTQSNKVESEVNWIFVNGNIYHFLGLGYI